MSEFTKEALKEHLENFLKQLNYTVLIQSFQRVRLAHLPKKNTWTY